MGEGKFKKKKKDKTNAFDSNLGLKLGGKVTKMRKLTGLVVV